MAIRDIMLAISITFFWGMGFVVGKVGVGGMSALVLCACRSLALFSVLPFIKAPQVDKKYIIGLGISLCIIHSVFVFLPMEMGLPASVTCLTLQTQVFFTVLLGAYFFKEHLSVKNLFAMTISFSGIAVLTGWSDGAATHKMALLIAVISAFTMGTSNMILKKIPKDQIMSVMAWAHTIVPIPLLIAQAYFYGPQSLVEIMNDFTWVSAGSIFYLSFVGLITYSLWGGLLQKYPTYYVAPFALLTPIFGVTLGVLLLNDLFSTKMLFASALVLSGLVINQYNPSVFRQRKV